MEEQDDFQSHSLLSGLSVLPPALSAGTLNASAERLPILMMKSYTTWKSQSCLILSASINTALGESGGQFSRRASVINPSVPKRSHKVFRIIYAFWPMRHRQNSFLLKVTSGLWSFISFEGQNQPEFEGSIKKTCDTDIQLTQSQLCTHSWTEKEEKSSFHG